MYKLRWSSCWTMNIIYGFYETDMTRLRLLLRCICSIEPLYYKNKLWKRSIYWHTVLSLFSSNQFIPILPIFLPFWVLYLFYFFYSWFIMLPNRTVDRTKYCNYYNFRKSPNIFKRRLNHKAIRNAWFCHTILLVFVFMLLLPNLFIMIAKF